MQIGTYQGRSGEGAEASSCSFLTVNPTLAMLSVQLFSASALALRQIMRDIGREFRVQQVPLQQVSDRWRANVLRSRCNGVPTTSIHVDAGYAGFYLSDVFSRVWEPYPVPEPPTRAETLNLTQMAEGNASRGNKFGLRKVVMARKQV
ncbi:hypothetical protein BDP27DRAFT_1374723, partial [Rhodocollybia butyracea]